MEMDSLQYIKLLALMATTLLKVGVLLESDLLNSREVSLAEGIVLNHGGDDGDVEVVVLVLLMEGGLGPHLEEGPGSISPRLHV